MLKLEKSPMNGFIVNGRKVAAWHIYATTGILFTCHNWCPEVYEDDVDSGTTDGNNKLHTIWLPTDKDVRRARTVDLKKGDVFSINTKNAQYSFETAECELYIPAALLGTVIIGETARRGDASWRDYMATCEVTLTGQLEPRRFLPDEVRAQMEAESGANWHEDNDAWTWARELTNRHPSKGWKPGPRLDAARVRLLSGRTTRTEKAPRQQAIEALAAKLPAGRSYSAESIVKALVESDDLFKMLVKARKASPTL